MVRLLRRGLVESMVGSGVVPLVVEQVKVGFPGKEVVPRIE